MRIEEQWAEAAHDLGLDLVVPFTLDIAPGKSLVARALLKGFGAPNGMLLLSSADESYDEVKHLLEAVPRAGYGYSFLGDSDRSEPYSRASFIGVLQDWGWAGPSETQPHWLVP